MKLRGRHQRLRAVVVMTVLALLGAGAQSWPAAATPSTVPVKCLASPSVLSIAGSDTTYSLDSNGSLWGWGNNFFGQIGNGTTTDATAPLNASGFNSLQAVAAGADTVVVLRQDGTVWAWGDDQVGQLGDGRSGSNVVSTVPQQVPGLANVTAIAANASDSVFALKSDGTVWAWGYNSQGQLGDGTATDRAVPTQITSLAGVVGISLSETFGVAVKSNGTVWAWGLQTSGQLGSSVPQGVS